MARSPWKRPMPWSTWTTRSPAARLVTSAMKFSARFVCRRYPPSCSPKISWPLIRVVVGGDLGGALGSGFFGERLQKYRWRGAPALPGGERVGVRGFGIAGGASATAERWSPAPPPPPPLHQPALGR